MADLTWSLQHKRDTAANWAAGTKVLKSGQFGIETDTGKFKINLSSSTANWNDITDYYINFDSILDLLATPIRDCGTWDASGNVFPTTGGTGTLGAIEKGNQFTISVSGTLGGTAVTAPYSIIRALVDTPGQTSTNWYVLPASAPASASQIITTIASSSTPTPVVSTNTEKTDWLVVTALAANATIAAPTGTATNLKNLRMRFKDNGVARTLTWNAVFAASTDLTLPTTTVINTTTSLGFTYNSAMSKWVLMAKLENV